MAAIRRTARLASPPRPPLIRRPDAHGWVRIEGRIPPTLRAQLHRWAAEQEMPVQYALEQAIRLLVNQPEPETPYEEVP